MVKLAVQNGMAPLEALCSASLRPARYLGLRDLGAIAPGYKADFLVLDDLALFPPRQVWVGGQKMAADGKMLPIPLPASPPVPDFPPVPGPLRLEDFRILPPAEATGGWMANAVRLEGALTSLTSLEQVPLNIENGFARFLQGDDLALAAIFARGGESRCVGVMKGIGIDSGAAATSMAHDSHNLLVVGRDAPAMLRAANAVHAMGGGVAVADQNGVIAALELPVFSLISDRHVDEVAEGMERVEDALSRVGFRHKRPFLLLSLLSLSVSPYYKFSDKGVVDTENRALLPPVFRR
jgi:adenine deaminase